MVDEQLERMVDEVLGLAKPSGNGHNPESPIRRLNLQPASEIKPRPVQWLWEGRMPLGALTLVGGREGIGKSIMSYTLVASITKGELDGIYHGTPKSVIVAATEDSWAHTIVPRLMAADADLKRVFRVDVITDEGLTTNLTLPVDLIGLEQAVEDTDAALILLDPLLSRLSAKLDTHKDAEVRIALEPLTDLADRAKAAVAGLIHVNKGAGTDPLTLLMGSRAFASVARAVLFVMMDPEDESGNLRMMGTPKNNLGRTDLPTLAFSIGAAHVATTDEGEVWTGRLDWQGESSRSIDDAMTTAGEGMEERTATTEAMGWLQDYLTSQGGSEESATVKREGAKHGHNSRTLQRAAARLRLLAESGGFPRRTTWTIPSTVMPVVPVVPGTVATTSSRPISPAQLDATVSPLHKVVVTTTESDDASSQVKSSSASYAYQPSPQGVGTTVNQPLSPDKECPF